MNEDQLKERLVKTYWARDLAMSGRERKEGVSPDLAEALRNEIRKELDAGGKPFDVNVARRVYDLAIAARDMCLAATGSVKEVVDQIKETNGPLETLGEPDPSAPAVQAQASETFGARIIRELMAMLPIPGGLPATPKEPSLQDLVAAIADARERKMPDLAAELERKLLGTPLETQPITRVEVVDNSYEHGFIDGSMQDNFDQGTVNGHAGRNPQQASPAYREGFAAAVARRQSWKELTAPDSVASTPEAADARTWICAHGNRHPEPEPGYVACCSCPAGGAS